MLANLPADTPHTFLGLVSAILSIIFIDIVLAGDNAVVIALAVRKLKRSQRLLGIALGSGMAVLLRVGLTFVAAQLLEIHYIKLVGGILVFWIAIKLLVSNMESDEGGRTANTIWSAVWVIMVADITMSLDNVLAVAGASKGSLELLLFGLGLSIPLVVFTSSLLARLMDRYPIIVWIGAAVLGKVGGDMVMTDPYIMHLFAPSPWLVHTAEVLGASLVVFLGWILRRRSRGRSQVTGQSD